MMFYDCNVSKYYEAVLSKAITSTIGAGGSLSQFQQLPLETKERSVFQSLTQDRHRNALSYSEVWGALEVLDKGNTSTVDSPTVRLIYGDRDVSVLPRGTSATWNREHLWPRSKGLGSSGPDYTDLFNLRPADASINTSRSDKFYGPCGLVRSVSECRTPSHPEAANDTSSDSYVFLPPAHQRGDIARALFYMDLRYDGANGNSYGTSTTRNLELTDCPGRANDFDSSSGYMAYLSQLLEWHEMDPVDDMERQRNDVVCQEYQGNRNPYVDFPDQLVNLHFKHRRLQVLADPSTGGGYSSCSYDVNDDVDTENDNPDFSAEEEEEEGEGEGTCRGMQPGDVMVLGFQTSGTDDVLFVSLADLPPSSSLYMTDNAWTGGQFRSTEGIVKFSVPSKGLQAGTIFGYNAGGLEGYSLTEHDSRWEKVGGTFNLAKTGDNIMLYCITSPSTGSIDASSDQIRHLSSLIYGDNWLPPGQEESVYGSLSSSLPSSLNSISKPPYVSLSALYDYSFWYIGPYEGNSSSLKGSISNSSYWFGSDSAPLNMSPLLHDVNEFIVLPSAYNDSVTEINICDEKISNSCSNETSDSSSRVGLSLILLPSISSLLFIRLLSIILHT